MRVLVADGIQGSKNGAGGKKISAEPHGFRISPAVGELLILWRVSGAPAREDERVKKFVAQARTVKCAIGHHGDDHPDLPTRVKVTPP